MADTENATLDSFPLETQNKQQALLWRLLSACFGQGEKAQNLESLSKEIAAIFASVFDCFSFWIKILSGLFRCLDSNRYRDRVFGYGVFTDQLSGHGGLISECSVVIARSVQKNL